ncbi:MAG: hypothetical protein ACIAXF_10480 [Phycisphaerales bacterium JB063]
MFFWRKIGKTLRGSVKPYQVISAAMLGGLIGFAPSVAHGPLWLALLLMLLAILNANFFVATFTAGVAKLLSYLLLPISFQLGLLLVDGPMESTFRWLINTPVTALMGFEYYTTAGGIVLGGGLGAGFGVSLVWLLRRFRSQMAKLETDSKKYHDWAGKGWVKMLSWVFFGGKAKQSYAELMEQKKFGNPVRPLGIVFALLLAALLFVVQQFGSGPIVAWAMQDGLQRFTGATVDIDDAEIDLASGKMTVGRLAVADPNALDTDMLRATRLTADISTSDLLRKRITLDSVVIDDAQAGVPRAFPGRRIGEPTPDPPPSTGEGKTLEEWFETGKVWRNRLETARDLLDRLRGIAGKDDDSGTIRGRARDRAEQLGYANVRAAHLIEGAPTLLVRDLKINTIRADWPVGETTDVHATNLSTHPGLVSERPRVVLNTSGQTLALDATLAPRGSGLASELSFALRNQSVDAALGAMDLGSQATVSGGAWSVALDGGWSEAGIDLPMVLSITDTVVALPDVDAVTLDNLPIRFGVTGELGAPRLALDREQLVQTLMDAGARQIAGQYLQLGEDKLRASILDGIDEEHREALAPLLGPEGSLIERGGNLLRGVGDRLRGDGASPDTD